MSSANQQNNSLLRSIVNMALLAGVATAFAPACVSSSDNNNDATGGANAGTVGGESSTGGSSSTTAATGGSATTAGGSSSASNTCPTTSGTYTENTTFPTPTGTNPIAPYNLNPFGFAADATTVSQTTTGPTGLDCSSGCGVMTLKYTDGIAQYGAGAQFVEYFGTAADSTQNILNETVTAEIAVTVEPAGTAVPVTVVLTGQDTFATTTYVDNNWSYDLGTLSALDASKGWHKVTYKVADAHVPSWSPTRWVCSSALHDIAIAIQNNGAVTSANAGVVTLYVKSISIAP